MKLGIATPQTLASDGLVKSMMGVTAKGVIKLQHLLRDKIYTDKVGAVIREYVSNAWDEHVKHNVKTSVQIKMYRDNDRIFWSVRDYGKGLDEKGIRDIFAMYGESTKDRENNSIGGFGVGAKSAFCVTTEFTVNSFHNGIKTQYLLALSGTDDGFSVGEVYKLFESPTDETGIEILIDVTKVSHEFEEKTEKFVSHFDPEANIEFNRFNYSFVRPLDPDKVVKAGDFKINLYERESFYDSYEQVYGIRMGGIMYAFESKRKSRSFTTPRVVIDVPIGMLKIPLTREKIEQHSANEQVLNEIDAALDALEAKELESIKKLPKFSDYYFDTLGQVARMFYGEVFKFQINQLFPWTCRMKQLIHKKDWWNATDQQKPNNYIVYIIPSIKNTKSWFIRLQKTLKELKQADYKGFLWMMESDYNKFLTDSDKSTIDLSDFVFLEVKKLKLPKLEKETKTDDSSYLIYMGKSSQNKRYLSAKDLHKFVIDKHFSGTEPVLDWHTKETSRNIINALTVGLVDKHGTRAGFRTVNSEKMYANLVNLGWLTPDSPEYQKAMARIEEHEELQYKLQNIEYNSRTILFGIACNPRCLPNMKKNPEKYTKLKKLVESIRQEKTRRARILTSFNTYGLKLNRSDLREIMKMK